MVGWHHFIGHELGQIPRDGEGQRGLACCSSWDAKESDMIWQLNDNMKEILLQSKQNKKQVRPTYP